MLRAAQSNPVEFSLVGEEHFFSLTLLTHLDTGPVHASPGCELGAD